MSLFVALFLFVLFVLLSRTYLRHPKPDVAKTKTRWRIQKFGEKMAELCYTFDCVNSFACVLPTHLPATHTQHGTWRFKPLFVLYWLWHLSNRKSRATNARNLDDNTRRWREFVALKKGDVFPASFPVLSLSPRIISWSITCDMCLQTRSCTSADHEPCNLFPRISQRDRPQTKQKEVSLL